MENGRDTTRRRRRNSRKNQEHLQTGEGAREYSQRNCTKTELNFAGRSSGFDAQPVAALPCYHVSSDDTPRVIRQRLCSASFILSTRLSRGATRVVGASFGAFSNKSRSIPPPSPRAAAVATFAVLNSPPLRANFSKSSEGRVRRKYRPRAMETAESKRKERRHENRHGSSSDSE